MLEISVSYLDKDGFLLNMTDGTYYLLYGLEGKKDHSPEDYITKITAAPGDKGERLWLDFLDTIFCKDHELIDYVQQIVGIKCSECGNWYGSKVWHSQDKYHRMIFQCNRKFKNDKKCRTPLPRRR